MTLKIARQPPRIEYPESDGKPMAEAEVERLRAELARLRHRRP